MRNHVQGVRPLFAYPQGASAFSGWHYRQPLFAGWNKKDNVRARKKLLKAKAPDKLAKQLGGFVWSVSRHPRYWQVKLDIVGNKTGDRKAVQAWIDQNRTALNTYFEKELGVSKEQLHFTAFPMKRFCCHGGCSGCLNGKHDKLKHHLHTQA